MGVSYEKKPIKCGIFLMIYLHTFDIVLKKYKELKVKVGIPINILTLKDTVDSDMDKGQPGVIYIFLITLVSP